MAVSLKELEDKFIKADDAAKAGDPQAQEDAAVFASEIKRRKMISPPTMSEIVGAFGSSATGGALREGGGVTGAVMGTKAGMALGAFGGPAAPVTVPLGGLIGGTLGYFGGRQAGSEVDRYLGQNKIGGRQWSVPDPQKLPHGLKVPGEMGRVVGETVPFAGLPLAVGRKLPLSALSPKPSSGVKEILSRAWATLKSPAKIGNAISNIPQKVVQSAATSPGLYATGEAAGAFGSAVGAGTAEAVAPGQTGPRVAGEVVGGVISPARILSKFGGATVAAGKNVLRSLTKGGRETAAGVKLRNLLSELGENPDDIAKKLLEEDAFGLAQSSADKSGSITLKGMESGYLPKGSPGGEEIRAQRESTLDKLMSLYDEISVGADASTLETIAEHRRAVFSSLLGNRIARATEKADAAVAQLGGKNVTEDIAKESKDALYRVMRAGRDEESRLWRQVPSDLEGTHDNILNAYEKITGDRLPAENLGHIVEDTVWRFRKPEVPDPSSFKTPKAYEAAVEKYNKAIADYEPPTVGNLARFRSRMLANSRDAAAQGKSDKARVYGDLAEAALDDLNAIDALDPALDTARAYSKSFHDTFTRTFAGNILSKKGTGAARIPPELTLESAFSGKGRSLNFKQMREAALFTGQSREADAVFNAQDEFLRSAAGKLKDPITGRITPKRLAQFKIDEESALDAFPKIRDDLDTVVSAEMALGKTEAKAASAKQAAERTSAFAKILGSKNPVDYAAGIMRSGDTKAYNKFVKLARSGGPEGIAAAKKATLDAAFNMAERDGKVSFKELERILISGKRGRTPMINAMNVGGVLSSKETKFLKRLISEGVKVEEAGKRGVVFSTAETPDALFDLVVRISGANMGSVGAVGHSVGTPLIAAQAGSRFARNIFEKVPATRVGDVIREALKNPRFMAQILKKSSGLKDRANIVSNINAYLVQAGITTPQEEN